MDVDQPAQYQSWLQARNYDTKAVTLFQLPGITLFLHLSEQEMHSESAKLNIFPTFLQYKCPHLLPWMMWDLYYQRSVFLLPLSFLLLHRSGQELALRTVTRLCFGITSCPAIKSALLDHCKCGSGWVKGAWAGTTGMCSLNHIIA